VVKTKINPKEKKAGQRPMVYQNDTDTSRTSKRQDVSCVCLSSSSKACGTMKTAYGSQSGTVK